MVITCRRKNDHIDIPIFAVAFYFSEDQECYPKAFWSDYFLAMFLCEKKVKTSMHLNSTNSEETFLKDVVSGKQFFRVNTAYF